ncbi:hypothetical protein T11_11442 [Trichinella zimbabwensis]|uniref:Uncharacterized protein n=1 Tax=Trichinella zimbabwensis TaxID=268475 RepID=A0A0V1H5T1_9BILA|nr:hypothetical protein T11_11442 [Trichinella zimbabwensis]
MVFNQSLFHKRMKLAVTWKGSQTVLRNSASDVYLAVDCVMISSLSVLRFTSTFVAYCESYACVVLISQRVTVCKYCMFVFNVE